MTEQRGRGETPLTFPRARREEQEHREGRRYRGRGGGNHTAVSGWLAGSLSRRCLVTLQFHR